MTDLSEKEKLQKPNVSELGKIAEDPEVKNNIVQFSGDEYLQILDVVQSFTERGASENPAKFVVFIGGVGAGKTTMRRNNFATGHVHFDFGEIYTAMKKVVGSDRVRIAEYVALASDLILRESLTEKKNIVIEIVGENADMITPVISKMKEIGYAVSIEGIVADIAESYKRHLQAIDNDPEYISAAHTQEATLGAFFGYFNLGAVPKS